MNKLRVAIIEDEYPAVRLLNKLLTDLRPEWEIELLPGSVEEAVGWFRGHPDPDLIFLDIHLSDGNSFRFIEQARPRSVIIFTTAYDNYAIQAFTVNSIDYLLKPITRERLEEAVLKFERLYRDTRGPYSELLHLEEVLKSVSQPGKKFRSRFLISTNGRLSALEVGEVAYFRVEERAVTAVTFSGREHVVDVTLNRLEQELDPDLFCRVNRQFILSVRSIRKIELYLNSRYLIHVTPPSSEQIIVSREKMGQLKAWLSY